MIKRHPYKKILREGKRQRLRADNKPLYPCLFPSSQQPLSSFILFRTPLLRERCFPQGSGLSCINYQSPNGQPDLDNSSLQLSSHIILGCVKLIMKTNWHQCNNFFLKNQLTSNMGTLPWAPGKILSPLSRAHSRLWDWESKSFHVVPFKLFLLFWVFSFPYKF